jgi:drug/metabolite transporter (DMT)-like permease
MRRAILSALRACPLLACERSARYGEGMATPPTITPIASAERRSLASAHWALIVVQLCFGLFPVFGKLALAPGGFGPLAIAGWRMLFGGVALFALALVVHGRKTFVGVRDLALLFCASLLGVTLNMVFYLEGLSRSTPNNATLIMGLIPVFTFTIAVAVKSERLSGLRALGVAIALLGASLRFFDAQPDLAVDHVLGNALMALNALCYAAYFVLSRPLLARLPALVVIAWVFLLSVPFVPLFAYGQDFFPATAGPRMWWSLAFILVFPTLVAYVLNIYALARVKASTTAIYIYVQPLITGIASLFMLNEEPTLSMLASAVCVFAGIWLVARKPAAGTGTLTAHGNAQSS